MKIKDHFLSQESFEIIESKTKGVYKTHPIPANLDSYYNSENYISHHQENKSLKVKIYKFLQKFNIDFKGSILQKEIQNNGTVLDYGCGSGDFLKSIENKYQTFGFEPNEIARSATHNKLKKTKVISDLEEINDHSLDAISLWHVFEHIENQEDILNIFYNKLKTNGILIIAVPNCSSFDAKYYKEKWAAYDVPRHIYHFSKSGMQNLMNNDHWQIKKISPLLLDSFYISILSEKYSKNPLFWLKGTFVGAFSNFKAIKNNEFSSLIYVIEKK